MAKKPYPGSVVSGSATPGMGYVDYGGDVGIAATYNAIPGINSINQGGDANNALFNTAALNSTPLYQQQEPYFYHKFTYDTNLSDPYASVKTSDLGWRPDLVSQLGGYGITEIPAWMKYLGKSGRERSDLAEGINRALKIDPYKWLETSGKRSKAMHNVGISGAEGGRLYGGFGKQTVEWTPETKAAVQQAYLNRLTKPNHGGFNPLGQEMAGLGIVLAPIALATGAWAAGPPAAGAVGAAEGAGVVGAEGAAAGAGAAGLGGATAAGAGETAAMGTAALSAGLPASVGTTAAMGSVPEMIAASSAIFGSGLGSMLGELGAYGLGELGSLISGGADLFSGMDIGKLIGNGTNLGNLIGGGTPGGIIAAPTTIQGGSTSAPQTSQIIPGGPTFNPQSVITPAAMPTSSIMGAFGNSDTKEPEYLKYFTSLF